ncbi:hypothetical protein ACIBF1_33005 [Spirillospora sp. NPDC050679]
MSTTTTAGQGIAQRFVAAGRPAVAPGVGELVQQVGEKPRSVAVLSGGGAGSPDGPGSTRGSVRITAGSQVAG